MYLKFNTLVPSVFLTTIYSHLQLLGDDHSILDLDVATDLSKYLYGSPTTLCFLNRDVQEFG